MQKIGIGLLGLGTVGSGVVTALSCNRQEIRGKLKAELEIRRILVRDPGKARPVEVARDLLTTDFGQIAADPSIQIVVDAMGGTDPARQYILAALAKGKHVVTANKEVVAKYGREILAEAEKHGTGFCFEASVGGGIPVIRPLKESLAADKVEEVLGIINGTTNYILSKMASEGKEFNLTLQEAQEKGYAEPDPTNDVEGFDAAYKLAILTALAFGTPVKFEDISFEGIRRIAREDMAWASELGYVIKLVAAAKERESGLEAWVSPCLLPLEHPLAQVNDVFNGILIKGNLAGELLFTGRGAGGLPTASAVAADIMAVAQKVLTGQAAGPVCTCYRAKPVLPKEEVTGRYYLRVKVKKGDAALPVNNLLIQERIGALPVAKKFQQGKGGTLVYFTQPLQAGTASRAAAKLGMIPGVQEVSLLRLEGLPAAAAWAAATGK